MSRITVDPRSRTPIFEQIISSVHNLVIKGLLLPDEPLPSVRALASELAINPNTIQKAYTELERQGVTYSLAGRGNFIASDISKLQEAHKNDIKKALEKSVTSALQNKISPEEILDIINNLLKNREEESVND